MAMRAFAASLGRASAAAPRLTTRLTVASAPFRHAAARALSTATKPVLQHAALADVDVRHDPDYFAPPPALPHARGDLTPAIRGFFDSTDHEFPVLAVDISVVEWGYRALASALPNTDIY